MAHLKTVFCLLDMRAFSWLVAGVTPFSLRPVIGHLGTEGRFFRYCKRKRQCGDLVKISAQTKAYLEDQLATRGPDNLPLVALGVVGQPPAVGDALDHLVGLRQV